MSNIFFSLHTHILPVCFIHSINCVCVCPGIYRWVFLSFSPLNDIDSLMYVRICTVCALHIVPEFNFTSTRCQCCSSGQCCHIVSIDCSFVSLFYRWIIPSVILTFKEAFPGSSFFWNSDLIFMNVHMRSFLFFTISTFLQWYTKHMLDKWFFVF